MSVTSRYRFLPAERSKRVVADIDIAEIVDPQAHIVAKINKAVLAPLRD